MNAELPIGMLSQSTLDALAEDEGYGAANGKELAIDRGLYHCVECNRYGHPDLFLSEELCEFCL